MWGTGFDWLDGTVRVPAPMPAAWKGGLDDFYQGPNDERWGGSLCRVLYHETIHFWQLLSSAYVANLVQAEWLRLAGFEETGRWRPVDETVAASRHTGRGYPFAAIELLECWARYWDVHTRHAGRLLREDGIDASHLPSGPDGAYSAVQFDRFMQEGRDSAVYARPYRWALDRADGQSALVNLILPSIVFCAFGSPDPVAVFVGAVDRARKSDRIRRVVRGRTGSINVDWLHSYPVVITEAVVPTVRSFNMPSFTAGWDVLARGRLGEHPIYGTYLPRIDLALRSVRRFDTGPPRGESIDETLRVVTTRSAVRDPAVMFMFPGQPTYRAHLGRFLPPPRIRFADTVWHAEVTFAADAIAKLQYASGASAAATDVRLDARYVELDARLQRFRDAEYAARRGLAPTTFST